MLNVEWLAIRLFAFAPKATRVMRPYSVRKRRLRPLFQFLHVPHLLVDPMQNAGNKPEREHVCALQDISGTRTRLVILNV